MEHEPKDGQQPERINVRKLIVDNFFERVSDRKDPHNATPAGTIQVFRDGTNPYVLIVSLGGKRFKVRIKETES